MKRRTRQLKELFLLPNQFHDAHQFCFFLHDLLVEVLISAEKSEIFHVSFEPKSKKDLAQFRKLKPAGEDLWEWLKSKGYDEMTFLMTYKFCIPALLSDFCQFVYAALRNSEQGKLTVALSLLRKPFKDDLLYLEWLLARPGEFLAIFAQGAKRMETYLRDRQRKRSIVTEAVTKIGNKLVHHDLIFDLRYTKDYINSFDQLWDKATHLITTYSPIIQTEHQNFNFIFSNDLEKTSQWNFIYKFLPFLLFYAVEVIEALLQTFAVRKNSETDTTDFRRIVGYILWLRNTWGNQNVLKALTKDLRIHCSDCNANRSWSLKNLKLFYSLNKIQCPKCNKTTIVRFPRRREKSRPV